MKYTCTTCGEEHEGWPSPAFDSPFHYHNLSQKDKEEIASINEDFCIIRNENQIDRFIRVVLKQAVIDACQKIEYGVWVSVSEKTFKEYSESFGSGEHEGGYFGYLCNNIPGYDSTLLIKCNVFVSKGKNRPEAVPHDDQLENVFVRDYYEGIDLEEAERRVVEAFGK